MKRKIEKGSAQGIITAPPSKSFAHRLLIASALAKGACRVDGIIDSVDMAATLCCISALGRSYKKTGDTVWINGENESAERVFNCYESGSTLRFFIPIALLSDKECTFVGTERLMSRGIEIYEEIFKNQNISCEKTKTTLTLKGKLKPDVFSLRGDVSSQFISGLMFALPLLDGDSVINITTQLESSAYIDITIEALKLFGVQIERCNSSFYIKGNQKYICANVTVEGDYSNAAFLDGFNLLGGDVSVLGLNKSSVQGDKAYLDYFAEIAKSNPTIDISMCPDLGPVLFALAAVKNGATFVGTKRLKIKESDRAEAMKAELQKFGVDVQVFENSVIVGNGAKAPSTTLCGHNDHRIVMALTLILTLLGGEIDGCEAVKKSYPDFFEDIAKLGIRSTTLDENN